MSDLRFNTIAGTVLAAGVLVMGLRQAGEVVFHRETPETPGYAVEIQVAAPASGPAEAAPVKPDFGRLFADEAQLVSLVAAGEKEHRVCTSCHSFEKGGANQTGPALWGVFGRVAGSYAGYDYSEAMTAYGKPWQYTNLYDYLAAPAKYVPGTTMGFAGVRSSEDRVALVAYLRSLSDSPAPLPEPLPEAPAADAAASSPPEAQTPSLGNQTAPGAASANQAAQPEAPPVVGIRP